MIRQRAIVRKENTINLYSLALFLHIVGTLGFFISLGLEWTSSWQMGGVPSSDLVRKWMRIAKSTRHLGMGSMLVIFASGAYMTATVWGGLGQEPGAPGERVFSNFINLQNHPHALSPQASGQPLPRHGRIF